MTGVIVNLLCFHVFVNGKKELSTLLTLVVILWCATSSAVLVSNKDIKTLVGILDLPLIQLSCATSSAVLVSSKDIKTLFLDLLPIVI